MSEKRSKREKERGKNSEQERGKRARKTREQEEKESEARGTTFQLEPERAASTPLENRSHVSCTLYNNNKND